MKDFMSCTTQLEKCETMITQSSNLQRSPSYRRAIISSVKTRIHCPFCSSTLLSLMTPINTFSVTHSGNRLIHHHCTACLHHPNTAVRPHPTLSSENSAICNPVHVNAPSVVLLPPLTTFAIMIPNILTPESSALSSEASDWLRQKLKALEEE